MDDGVSVDHNSEQSEALLGGGNNKPGQLDSLATDMYVHVFVYALYVLSLTHIYVHMDMKSESCCR